MSERYARSVCAGELLLRNAIIQKVAQGWSMVESCHLPETVDGSERTGKEPVSAMTEVRHNATSPLTDTWEEPPAVAGTQDTIWKERA